MTSRTTILFGPPGTGKTTALLNAVDEAMRYGVPTERIGYFAFTHRAADEAVTRAKDKFGCDKRNLPWFRTLHSAAFKLMGLRPDEVMSNNHYEEIGKALGSYIFTHQYDETMERPPPGGGLGDRALAIYALARARGVSVEQAWRESILPPTISLEDAVYFEDAVKSYKRCTGLVEFCDFMDMADGELDFEIMIIDEAQDLTRQQWEFARRIGRKARTILLAGDDDQCIFQWAGADWRMFLEFNGERRTLPRSYRLPAKIWHYANELAQRIKVRQSKQWEPRSEKGEIHFLDFQEKVPLRSGQWLLLCRNRSMMPSLVRTCRDQGVVYQWNGQWSNQSIPVRAVVDYERVRHGEALTLSQANRVIRFIPGMMPKESGRLETFNWLGMGFPFVDRLDWMTALSGLPLEEREYIRRLRRENESLSKPGRVVISSIHGSKGGESENVLLLPDCNTMTMKSMVKDPDSETRVWYVAASRAKSSLFLVNPKSRRHFS